MPEIICAFDAELIEELEARVSALRSSLADITFGEYPNTGTHTGVRVSDALREAYGSLFDALEGMWEMLEDRRTWEAQRAIQVEAQRAWQAAHGQGLAVVPG